MRNDHVVREALEPELDHLLEDVPAANLFRPSRFVIREPFEIVQIERRVASRAKDLLITGQVIAFKRRIVRIDELHVRALAFLTTGAATAAS